MELIKHHKTKPFSRKNMMDIAKIIRNCHISVASREIVTRALANYFEKEDPFFDRKMFKNLSSGTLDSDPKTARYSTIQEKQNDSEV